LLEGFGAVGLGVADGFGAPGFGAADDEPEAGFGVAAGLDAPAAAPPVVVWLLVLDAGRGDDVPEPEGRGEPDRGADEVERGADVPDRGADEPDRGAGRPDEDAGREDDDERPEEAGRGELAGRVSVVVALRGARSNTGASITGAFGAGSEASVFGSGCALVAGLSACEARRASFSAARLVSCSLRASDFLRCGPMTIVMLRPSWRGEDSTEPRSETSSARRCRRRIPISGRDCSRPRNMIITLTLSPPSRNRTT
jgi:hypothetical protein